MQPTPQNEKISSISKYLEAAREYALSSINSKELISRLQSAELYINKATTLYQQGDGEKADRLLEEVIKEIDRVFTSSNNLFA